MRRTAVLIALGFSALQASATPPSRSDEIWAAAQNRILTQQDLWFDDGEFLSCIQLLKVEAERFPDNYDVWTNLGWMQENVEEWDQALATYVRYRRLNPQDPDNALPEAFYYARKRLYTKVPELLEPAIKRDCHPNNYRLLANAYERQKMYTDAVRVWKVYLARLSVRKLPVDRAAVRNLGRDEQKLTAGA